MTRRLRRLRRKFTPRKVPGYDIAKLSAACDAAMAGLRRTDALLRDQQIRDAIHRCAVSLGVSLETIRLGVVRLMSRRLR